MTTTRITLAAAGRMLARFLADPPEPDLIQRRPERAAGGGYLEVKAVIVIWKETSTFREFPKHRNDISSSEQDLGIPLGRAKRSNLHEDSSWGVAAV